MTSARAGLRLARAAAKSPVIGQTAVFAGSTTIGNVLAAVAKALLARTMSVTSFGAYAFGLSLLQFVAMFFEFGLFQPAARLVALADRSEQRQILGAAIILFIPVGVLLCATIFAASFVVNSLFHVDAGGALRSAAPLAFVFAFPFVGLALVQGLGRVHLQALVNLTAQVLFTGALLVITIASWHVSVALALVLRCATLGAGAVLLVVWLQPVIADLSRHTRKLFVQAREYGFHIYVGRVLSIGTYNMDVLMLAALTNARAVGLYSLAGAVAAGLGLPMNAFASVLFRRMVQSERLDRRWLALSWSVGALTVVGAAGLGGVVLRAVFSGSYAAAASLLVPLTMAEAMRGTTGLYNAFLTAHARGRELRNAGLVLTISNVILNFALIPPFGAAGAAWASVLALVANLGAHVIGYRRVVGAPRASVEDVEPTPERVTPAAP